MEHTDGRREILKRFQRALRELQVTKDENGKVISYQICGFKYEDFNRAGFLSFTKLCKHLEFPRFLSLTGAIFSLSSNDQSLVLVVGGLHIEVSQALYTLASLTWKMRFVYKLLHIGNSSALFQVIMIDEKSGSVMASALRHMVCIDLKTRKTAPFSLSLRQKATATLSKSDFQGYPRLVLPPFDRNDCFSCRITAKNTEMDMYNHTTQVVYVEYAMECAAQAAATGYFKELKGDICSYCVKMASFLHLGESYAGDELSVFTWEDDSNPMLLYFIVSNSNRDIFQAKIEFYDSYISSHL